MGDTIKIPFSVYDFFAYLSSGFLALYGIDYFLSLSRISEKDLGVVNGSFLVVLSYLVGNVIAHFSSLLLEKNLLRKLIRSPEYHLFESPKSGWRKFLFPTFVSPFPEETQKKVKKRAEKEGFSVPSRSLFYHCHTLAKADEPTFSRLNIFLNLYGFSRNISFLGLAVFALFLISSWVVGTSPEKVGWGLVALGAFVVFFYRYLKFFRHFTEEVFRYYAALPANPHG